MARRRAELAQAALASGQQTIADSFSSQSRPKKCLLCGVSVPSGKYASHFSGCALDPDDDEIQELYANVVKIGSTCTDVKVLETKVRCDVGSALTLPGDNEGEKTAVLERRILRSKKINIGKEIERTEEVLEEGGAQTTASDENSCSSSAEFQQRLQKSAEICRHIRQVAESSNRKRRAEPRRLFDDDEASADDDRARKIQPIQDVMDVEPLDVSSCQPLLSNVNPSPDPVPLLGMTERILRKLRENIRVNLRADGRVSRSPQKATVASMKPSSEDGDSSPRVPTYVSIIYTVFDRVLSTTSFGGRRFEESFWGEDLRLIYAFIAMSEDSKHLFTRFFMRKRGWQRLEELKSSLEFIADLDGCLNALCNSGLFERSTKGLRKLDDMLKLMNKTELTTLARSNRLDHRKGKHELSKQLMEAASNQRVLFGGDKSTIMLKEAKKIVGMMFRITWKADVLFRSFLTLYSPSCSDSQLVEEDPGMTVPFSMLKKMREAYTTGGGRPVPVTVDTLIDIYHDKAELFQYVECKLAEEQQIRRQLRKDHETVNVLGREARERLASLTPAEESRLLSLPRHLLRFTSSATDARMVKRGAESLEKEKKHHSAVNWQKFLLSQTLFTHLLSDVIGQLFERLALNLDFHCKQPLDAIDELRRGLNHALVPQKNALALADRLGKLDKENERRKEDILVEAASIVVEGNLCRQLADDSRKNRFLLPTEGGDKEASVEEVALDYYLKRDEAEFVLGVHSEGRLWHLLLHLFFQDLLFDRESPALPDVWFCELQSYPLDLNCCTFYERRASAVDSRLAGLGVSSVEQRIATVTRAWQKASDTEGLSLSQVAMFVRACPVEVLKNVFEILLKNHRHRRSGFPDLVLWNKHTIAVSEVKGPGDSLSWKQRLWLDFFSRNGIRAEVCLVRGVNRRRLS